MTPPDLTGKVVVITSAKTGIAPALARSMAEAGANVVVVGTSDSSPRGATRLHYRSADTRVREEIEAVFDDIGTEFGALDILVNGMPALGSPRSAEAIEARGWEDLSLDLAGTFYCCQAAGRYMLSVGRGVIVNLSLAIGLHPVQGFAAESAISGATIALTQALGIEWARRGVRVVGVAIGPLDVIPDIFGDVLLRTPLQRRGVVRELSDAVMYLASDDAAFVTAETLRVDGGWSASQMF